MKKMFNMKRLALIAVVFMMVFVAFSSIDFINSAKAAISEPVESAPDDDGSTPESAPSTPVDPVDPLDDPPGNPPDEECAYFYIDGEWVYQCPDDDGYDEYFIDDDDDTGNLHPVADDDSATVNEDSALNQINALNNDYDPDGDTITISSVGSASHGITSTDGIYAFYTPNANYFGSDQFTYTIFDGNGGSDTATVTVTVNSVNNPPVANEDSAAVDEGETITQLDGGASSVLDNDFDPDSDPLTANLISGPSHASSFNLNSDGSFSYTHDGSKTISDSFTYEADDGNRGTDTATVDITINPDTDIPEKPTIEGGIQTCYTGISYNFESALSGIGPNAHYYFDWDDGEEIPDPALWTPVAITPLSGYYIWNNKAGVYDVRVYVVIDDLVNGGTIIECSLPLPVQVLHKSENPEDGEIIQ